MYLSLWAVSFAQFGNKEGNGSALTDQRAKSGGGAERMKGSVVNEQGRSELPACRMENFDYTQGEWIKRAQHCPR
jgi:hypothetical protein